MIAVALTDLSAAVTNDRCGHDLAVFRQDEQASLTFRTACRH